MSTKKKPPPPPKKAPKKKPTRAKPRSSSRPPTATTTAAPPPVEAPPVEAPPVEALPAVRVEPYTTEAGRAEPDQKRFSVLLPQTMVDRLTRVARRRMMPTIAPLIRLYVEEGLARAEAAS